MNRELILKVLDFLTWPMLLAPWFYLFYERKHRKSAKKVNKIVTSRAS